MHRPSPTPTRHHPPHVVAVVALAGALAVALGASGTLWGLVLLPCAALYAMAMERRRRAS